LQRRGASAWNHDHQRVVDLQFKDFREASTVVFDRSRLTSCVAVSLPERTPWDDNLASAPGLASTKALAEIPRAEILKATARALASASSRSEKSLLL
jgi:hypothetical protein